MQQQTIKDYATKGIAEANLPAPVKQNAIDSFTKQQKKFSSDVTDAFASSLHRVFIVSGSLMALGFIAVLFIREKPLRTTAASAVARE